MTKTTASDRRGAKAYASALKLARAKRRSKALPLLQEAVVLGDSRAKYALGTWFLHGAGVKRDVARGGRLIARAGVVDAQYDLAVCYERGVGRAKNLRRAFAWYTAAAKNGDTWALGEVARCLFYGIGVRRDMSLAVDWWKRAARRGDAEAAHSLSLCYELGEGVDADVQTSKRWFERATELEA